MHNERGCRIFVFNLQPKETQIKHPQRKRQKHSKNIRGHTVLCVPLGGVQLLLSQCNGNKLKHFDVRYVNRKFTNSKMASAVPGLQAANFNLYFFRFRPCCAVALLPSARQRQIQLLTHLQRPMSRPLYEDSFLLSSLVLFFYF